MIKNPTPARKTTIFTRTRNAAYHYFFDLPFFIVTTVHIIIMAACLFCCSEYIEAFVADSEPYKNIGIWGLVLSLASLLIYGAFRSGFPEKISNNKVRNQELAVEYTEVPLRAEQPFIPVHDSDSEETRNSESQFRSKESSVDTLKVSQDYEAPAVLNPKILANSKPSPFDGSEYPVNWSPSERHH